jgi:hypothetical protein
MNYETTRITSMNIHVGEQPITGTHIKIDSFGALYGFIFTGDVTLVFDSKESINTLQNALTELKEKWIVEEQMEVTASA